MSQITGGRVTRAVQHAPDRSRELPPSRLIMPATMFQVGPVLVMTYAIETQPPEMPVHLLGDHYDPIQVGTEMLVLVVVAIGTARLLHREIRLRP